MVDQRSPNQPSRPDLIAASDSGVSTTDNLTSDNTPTFNGTAEPGNTVELFADATSLGKTAVDGNGNWSITLTASRHLLTVPTPLRQQRQSFLAAVRQSFSALLYLTPRHGDGAPHMN